LNADAVPTPKGEVVGKLQGKFAVITGGVTGIGLAAAIADPSITSTLEPCVRGSNNKPTLIL
jgi:hypothetical protein